MGHSSLVSMCCVIEKVSVHFTSVNSADNEFPVRDHPLEGVFFRATSSLDEYPIK